MHQLTEEDRALSLVTPRGEGKEAKKRTLGVAAEIRKFLECSKEVVLREDPARRTRLFRMVANMVHIAEGKGPNSVAAFNALMDRAYGKSRPHDDALDAVAKGGLQIVYLNPPQLEGEVKEAGPTTAPSPEFIEAQFTEDEDGQR